MGLNDRTYWQEEEQAGYGGSAMGRMTMGLPKPSSAVKILLIMNVIVFVIQTFADQSRGPGDPGVLSAQFGVTVAGSWQVWRYITFQFLHGGFWHLLMNMLGLYFLGSPLERKLGRRRFVVFYLLCGVVAGVAYVVIGTLGELPKARPIIGASGGVFGIILAGAVYFPHFKLIFLFFPVPIRLAALIIFSGMMLLVLRSAASGQVGEAMSDVAHLGGAAAAAVWIWVLPRLRGKAGQTRKKLNQGAWQRKMKNRQAEHQEIDRILEKIKQKGINSLSQKEKDKLRQATADQRKRENDLYKA